MCQRLHQNDAQNKINLSNNAWIEKNRHVLFSQDKRNTCRKCFKFYTYTIEQTSEIFKYLL